MEPEKLYKFIWGELEASMHSLEHGGEVNMAALDKNVRDFCDIVTKLPPLQARQYDEKIHNIVQYLTDIVNRLTERKAEIGEQINLATNRRKAQSAYGVAMLHSSNEAK
jgi:glycyl-tRNA synthetase beta subunit